MPLPRRRERAEVRGREHLPRPGAPVVGGRDGQLVLGGEVVEERALGDAGGGAQVVDGGGVQPALPDDAHRRVEQPQACGAPSRPMSSWPEHTNQSVCRPEPQARIEPPRDPFGWCPDHPLVLPSEPTSARRCHRHPPEALDRSPGEPWASRALSPASWRACRPSRTRSRSTIRVAVRPARAAAGALHRDRDEHQHPASARGRQPLAERRQLIRS